tara:strand:- start:1004 stop:1285 length:282 start_codon:yes stop_codon:yes gene_type:complete
MINSGREWDWMDKKKKTDEHCHYSGLPSPTAYGTDEVGSGQPSPGDYEHATLILKEASAYGLEWEVKETAAKYVKEGYRYVDAFEMAYQDWVK